MNTSEIMSAMIFGDGGASKVEELSTDGGSTDAGKVLVVGDNGKIAASDLAVGEGTVAIDKGLTVNGAAADAKKTGDAIASLNGSLGDEISTDSQNVKKQIEVSPNLIIADDCIWGEYVTPTGIALDGGVYSGHTGAIFVAKSVTYKFKTNSAYGVYRTSYRIVTNTGTYANGGSLGSIDSDGFVLFTPDFSGFITVNVRKNASQMFCEQTQYPDAYIDGININTKLQNTQDEINTLKTTFNNRTVNGHSLSSNVTLTKDDVELENVDNTSDLNKPISTAMASALAAIETDIENEERARKDSDNTLQNRIATNENSISIIGTHKVNTPLVNEQPSYGTDGQVLRTKGDGTTEWAYVGLPTDEQTNEAVSSWLNNHPEATTTVQDGAITLPKMNDDALPFIANGGYVVQNAGDQLGAKVNAALNSYDVVIVSEGNYTLETKIIVPNRKTLVVHGDILYNGEDAAIELTNALYCNVHVNKIQAPNGSCIRVKATDNNLNEFNEIHSMYLYGKYCIDILNEGTSGIQHINFYSNYVRAIERCVSIVSTQESGWNGEIKFFGGEFNGTTAVGVYSNKSLTALRMFGVGFESLANILDITDGREITLTGCRNERAGKYIFRGDIKCVFISGDYYARRSIDIDGLTGTNGIVFKGIIYNDDNVVAGTELRIAPDMKMSITGCQQTSIAYDYYNSSRPIIGDKNAFPFIARLTSENTEYFLSDNYTRSAQKEVIIYAEKSRITLKNHDGSKTLFTTTESQSVWRITSAAVNSYFSPSGYLVEKITPYKQS